MMGNSETRYKAVLQLSTDEPAVHKSVVRQMNNVLNAMDKVDIELVIHGPGIAVILKDAPLANNLELLHQKGIKFLVCANTLQDQGLAAAALLAFAAIVPSGIAHLIIRQSEGWSYIKAGF